MRLLQRRRDGLPEEARAEADELLERRKEVGKRIREIAKMKIEAVKTRHHGDYHLGQVLVSNNDFQIIDFEGEPARPLEERRKKHSPLRDVAGMVRSFNYAAHAALQNVSAERMGNYDEMRGWAADWERRVRETFLEGYQGGVRGCPSYPENEEHAEALIELFTLEKALYEIRYELDNRPDWVGIPVRGILGLLDDRIGEEPS
jgi:maltose alpha-D-glucosyltransferase/alpha-amylase